jgi:hypothetical protein
MTILVLEATSCLVLTQLCLSTVATVSTYTGGTSLSTGVTIMVVGLRRTVRGHGLLAGDRTINASN